jgi:hypothetical protein
MAKADRRRLIAFEVSQAEEKMIDYMAKKSGINRSQYLRESVYFNLFMGGDFQIYKMLGSEFRSMTKEAIAGKIARSAGRRSPVAA